MTQAHITRAHVAADLEFEHSSIEETHMSHDNHTPHNGEQDVVESIVPLMPIVLPVAGAILIFLLAFIAVFMS